MAFFRVFLFMILLVSASFSPVFAQDKAPLEGSAVKNVNVRLLAERGVVGAGDEIWVAIDQSIRPEWHSYWKNPGDSGTPMRIKWDLPKGFEMGELRWPTPHKIPYAPLMNYGYEDHVILLQKLKTPKDMPVGAITLKAAYEVLVCDDVCVPEFGEETLILNGEGSLEEDNAAYIAKALDKVPKMYGQFGRYSEADGNFVMSFPVLNDDFKDVDWTDSFFVPEEWGIIHNVAEPNISGAGSELLLSQPRGERPLDDMQDLRVLVSFGEGRSVIVTAQKLEEGAISDLGAGGIVSVSPVHADGGAKEALPFAAAGQGGFLHALLFAFLGGLVLNLMPCVFPVLSIKALSLVKMSEENPWIARGHGIAYTVGVVLSFLVISGALIVLKSAGAGIGWGFQLQNPFVVSVLVYLLFLIGLNLAGFFEFSSRFSNFGSKLTQGHGMGGSFFTGMLATLVAAPCTAPFMGAAISFALGQSAFVGLLVFATLGFGLALPYLVLSFSPALRHILPKPGAWMDVFKQFLAFPMFASAIWLFWVLSQQVDPMGLLGAGFGLVLLAFGIWALKVRPKDGWRGYVVLVVAVLAFFFSVALIPYSTGGADSAEVEPVVPGEVWSTYSAKALETALSGSDPVFVEMTAAWCITCKINHRTSLGTAETGDIIRARKVHYLVGDWTRQDAEITKYLQRYGRNGVPLYVYYGRPDKNGTRPEAIILPQILTPAIVAKYLDQ